MFGFPFAVAKKFGDDRAGNLAALIAYYGFFSVFPLMLVFTTIVGFVLRGNPEAQQRVLDGLHSALPIVAANVNVEALSGSGIDLLIAVLLALWAGFGVVEAMQNAFNDVWYVTMSHRRSYVLRKLWDLAVLSLVGAAILASSALATVANLAPQARWVSIAGSLLINFGLLLVVFKILPATSVGWREVAPGAVVAAVLITLLQTLGVVFVQRKVANAGAIYGSFALVIGLLAWFYLGAQMMLYAAELNTVLKHRLWPRGLAAPTADADRRMEVMQAETVVRSRERSLRVSIEPADDGGSEPDGAAESGASTSVGSRPERPPG